MAEANEQAGGRKPYVRPELTRVELRPEEAVLGSCKSASSAGPIDTCSDIFGGCSTLGS